jgi:hypothetical protein
MHRAVVKHQQHVLYISALHLHYLGWTILLMQCTSSPVHNQDVIEEHRFATCIAEVCMHCCCCCCRCRGVYMPRAHTGVWR